MSRTKDVPGPEHRSVKSPGKLRAAFRWAFFGLAFAIRNEQNFRIELAGAGLALFFSVTFKISKGEWLAVILCSGAVLSAELFNTAIEGLCNIVSPGYNPAVKTIKDLSAAAVLIAAIAAGCCAAVIFLPRFIHLFNH